MDRIQLQRELEDSGVRPDAYSIDGPSEEAYCLSRSGQNWVVFYYERGIETGKKTFSSENEACEYLLRIVRKDPTTKRA